MEEVNFEQIIDLPFLGNVAIVDDQIEEVIGLMKFLSRNSIPFEYFDGKIESFPISKKSIQIIFLDLNIFGTVDTKTLVSTFIANVNSLIDKNNGPYCIAFWSNNYILNKKEIDDALKDLICKPEFCFDMEKSIISENDDLKIIKILKENLINGYKKNSLVYLMNFLSKSYSEEINKSFNVIDKFVLENVDANKKANSLIYYFLTKEFDKYAYEISKEKILNVFISIFNKYLLSKFNNILDDQTLNKLIVYNDSLIDRSINTIEFNTELIIRNKLDCKFPKNVYLASQEYDLETIIENKNIKRDNIKEVIYLNIDVTHLCTAARKKQKYRTLVLGVLVDDSSVNDYNQKKDFILYLDKVKYNCKYYHFLVYCNNLTTVLEDDIILEKAIFSISDKYFDHIRSCIALQYTKVGV